MTLDTLMLLVVTIYLVLIAYGVVRARRRVGGRGRIVATALMVVLPPALLAGALAVTGEGALVLQWLRLFLGMPVAGALVAFATARVAATVAS